LDPPYDLPPSYDLRLSRNHLCDLRVDAAHQASQISRGATAMANGPAI
jgi:hypothetical protein